MTLDSAYVAFEAQPALVVSMSVVLAAVVLFDANRLLRKHSPSLARADALRMRVVVVAFAFIAGGVAVLIATNDESGGAQTCVGQCGSPTQSMALLPDGASR